MHCCVLCDLRNKNYYSRRLSRLVSVKRKRQFLWHRNWICTHYVTHVGLAMSLTDVPSCEAYSFSTGSTYGLQEKSIHSHIGSFIRTAKLLVYRDCSRRGGSTISETESFIKLRFIYLYFLFSCYNYELTMTWTNVVQFSITKMAEACSKLSSN